MARRKSATESVKLLTKANINSALRASSKTDGLVEFYGIVEMPNPSRSYFVRQGGRLHSLKAIVAYALQKLEPNYKARDFSARNGALRLRELGFDVVHNTSKVEAKRDRQWISRLSRRGQSAFRDSLINVYGKCLFTGCTTIAALEAAHVVAVGKQGNDRSDNGILLRVDVHKLFDSNLIAVDPESGSISVSESCLADYGFLTRQSPLVIPNGGPNLSAFRHRWEEFQAKHHQAAS